MNASAGKVSTSVESRNFLEFPLRSIRPGIALVSPVRFLTPEESACPSLPGGHDTGIHVSSENQLLDKSAATESDRIRGMNRRTLLMAAPLAVLVPSEIIEALESTLASGHESLQTGQSAHGGAMGGPTVVYELRIYHVVSGKLDALVARFRDHTMKLFAEHGMKSVAYWTALDEPAKSSTFIYILEHPSREAAATNWKAFQDDPEWKSVKAKTEENGKLVEKVDSTLLTLTDFSPRLG
jgi:NIPSNAP